MKRLKKAKGITLIALVITIIILLILAGITLNTLWGEGGIINQAERAKIMNELATYKEQLDLFVKEKTIEDQTYEEESLTAGKTNLVYSTKKDEGGNIKTVIPGISNEYFEKLEIIKGELLINTKDKREIEIAQSMGIEVNPYDITEDGELLSSNGNLLLMDSNGTLTIPDRVTKIGEGAFANLEGLKTIIIPSTVTRIEQNAFAYNTTLETVIMQEENGYGVEHIGYCAFAECRNLTTVQMSNTVEIIGSQAFYYCTNLKNINLSNSLKTIGGYAFAGARNLSNLEFPEGLTQINEFAFTSCTNLETIKFSSTINKISGNAFNRCIKLKNIEIAKDNKNLRLENGILLCSDETGKNIEMAIILKEAIEMGTNTLTVPDTVTKLRNEQISSYEGIITTIQIPASTTDIEFGFFCDSITNVIISSDNPKYETYDNAVYTKDVQGTEVTILRYYGNEKEVTVKDGTKIIETYSFMNKTLNQINLPDSIEQIKSQAFSGCNNLKSIALGKNIKYFGTMSIYASGIKEITINKDNPNYSIREGAICNGEKVKALFNKEGNVFISPLQILGTIETYEILSSTSEGIDVIEIADYAFHGQSKMKNIVIPSTIKKIGVSFNYCSSLEKIEIPSSVTDISNSCFSMSQQLKEIIIYNVEGSIAGQPWGCIYGDKAIYWLGK